MPSRVLAQFQPLTFLVSHAHRSLEGPSSDLFSLIEVLLQHVSRMAGCWTRCSQISFNRMAFESDKHEIMVTSFRMLPIRSCCGLTGAVRAEEND